MHADTAASRAQPAPSSRSLAGDWPQLAAIALLVVVLVLLASRDGGYFPAAFTLGGALAFAGLAALVLLRPPLGGLPAGAAVALVALAAFAAWSGLSAGWSLVPDAPLLDMQRALLHLGLFALALLAADGGARRAGLLVWCVLGVAVVVAGAGLLSRLQPDLVAGSPLEPGTVDVRLSYPLGYWNAFGALATIGAVLAIGLAADPRAARILRAAAAGAAVPLLVAMYLSLSRGAWLALVLGIAALLALSRHRGTLLATLAVVGIGAGVALGLLRRYETLVDEPAAEPVRLAQGDAYTLRLAAIVVVVLAAQWLLATVHPPPRLAAWGRRARRPAVAVACAIVSLGLLAGLVVRDGDGGHPTVAAADDVAGWASRRWEDFASPSAQLPEQGTARLASTRSSRGATYRVALDALAAQPLRGEGAGSYEVRWMRARTIDDKLRDAHSLPLQTLAELGLVGFALLVAFVGAVLLALRRAMSGRGALRRSQAAAAGAAFVAWLCHASIDWDWEMPALTGAALVLGATLFATRPRSA